MDGSRSQGGLFSLDLLREVARWSVWLAVGFAVLGLALTRDWRFVAGCAAGAAADIGALYWIMSRIEKATDIASAGATLSLTFVAGRIVLKGLVLVAAVLLPAYLNLWGALAGVLVTDITLVTVGGVQSARQSFPKAGAKRS